MTFLSIYHVLNQNYFCLVASHWLNVNCYWPWACAERCRPATTKTSFFVYKNKGKPLDEKQKLKSARFISKMKCLLSTLLVLCCATLAVCSPVPVHNIQKRATVLETVGDTAAEQTGILNEGGEVLELLK